MRRILFLLIALALGFGVGTLGPIIDDADARNRGSRSSYGSDDGDDGKGYSHGRGGPIKGPIKVKVIPPEPFQETALTQDEGAATIEFIDEVPAGKRLVMQHVSLSGIVPSPESATVTCRLTVDDGETPSFQLVTLRLRVTTDRGATDDYVAEGPITLYADAGDAVRATCRGFDLNNDPVSQISLTGTLVGSLVDAE